MTNATFEVSCNVTFNGIVAPDSAAAEAVARLFLGGASAIDYVVTTETAPAAVVAAEPVPGPHAGLLKWLTCVRVSHMDSSQVYDQLAHDALVESVLLRLPKNTFLLRLEGVGTTDVLYDGGVEFDNPHQVEVAFVDTINGYIGDLVSGDDVWRPAEMAVVNGDEVAFYEIRRAVNPDDVGDALKYLPSSFLDQRQVP